MACNMFVRSLLRIVRPHALASHVAPRSAFSTFNTATASKLHRQPGLLASFSRAASATQAVPHACRYFSLSRISSRPAPTSIASRGFFSSSDGPRPSLSEVLSLTKLKAAQYGTWFAGGTVALVIVNIILRGMKNFMDMSLEQAANYGLMLGSCSTAFAASVLFIAHRRYAVDAVPVFKMALSRVQKETQIMNLIGRNVSAVKSSSDNYIKAYEMQQPSWVIQDRRLAWGGGFVKMIFPIKGSTGSAVVSVFATKEAGKYVIRQLGIQTVFADDIHLTGDPNIPLAGRELMIFEAKPKSSLTKVLG